MSIKRKPQCSCSANMVVFLTSYAKFVYCITIEKRKPQCSRFICRRIFFKNAAIFLLLGRKFSFIRIFILRNSIGRKSQIQIPHFEVSCNSFFKNVEIFSFLLINASLNLIVQTNVGDYSNKNGAMLLMIFSCLIFGASVKPRFLLI